MRMSFEMWIICGLITGLFGMAYFIYGKKQSKPVPLIAGIALMFYPYFVDSLILTILIGVALLVLPFVYKPS